MECVLSNSAHVLAAIAFSSLSMTLGPVVIQYSLVIFILYCEKGLFAVSRGWINNHEENSPNTYICKINLALLQCCKSSNLSLNRVWFGSKEKGKKRKSYSRGSSISKVPMAISRAGVYNWCISLRKTCWKHCSNKLRIQWVVWPWQWQKQSDENNF